MQVKLVTTMPELDPLFEDKPGLDIADGSKGSTGNNDNGSRTAGGDGIGGDGQVSAPLYHENGDNNISNNRHHQDGPQDAPQDVPQESPQDSLRDAPQGNPRDTAQEASQDAPEIKHEQQQQQQDQENLKQEEQPNSHHDGQAQPPQDDQQHGQQHGQQHDQNQPSSARPTMTSAEELQLAAQLSQDISQSIPSAMLDSAAATTDVNVNVNVNVDDSNLRASISEPPSDEHLSTEIQQHHDEPLHQEQHRQHSENHHLPPHEHDQSLQALERHLEHHGLNLPGHNQSTPQHHDASLQHHGQQSQHHFLPAAHQQQHQPPHQQPLHPAQPLPHHMQPHGSLGHSIQHYGPPISDNTPPRKRSKVSRACDECRRKKVKCDATSENGEDPCSNCRRSGITCLFSRIPQKRGPSKGYIKELADRINSIEGKLASEGGNIDTLSEILGAPKRDSSDIFSPTGHPDENSRKRPHSSISTGEFGTPPSSRQTAWGSEPRPIQPLQPSGQPYSANGLAPQPLGKPDAETTPQPAGAMDSLSLELEQNGAARELDDGAFTGYLNVVHQCYPLLAASKPRVEDRLLHCPPRLRDAFIEALYGTMQSFVSVPGLYTNGDVGSASRLITEWESESSPRTSVMNLVHLQTLILIAIATDNYGPSSLKGEHGGASKPSVLGRAVGLAYSMRLHVPSQKTHSVTKPDPDSDENVAARAWWTLIMLDRWNAISTSSPLFIPNDSVVILPSLNTLLGEGAFHLARKFRRVSSLLSWV